MSERAFDERDVFAYGKAAKEQRRLELHHALAGGGEQDQRDDDAALDRLADRLVDRMIARLRQEP